MRTETLIRPRGGAGIDLLRPAPALIFSRAISEGLAFNDAYMGQPFITDTAFPDASQGVTYSFTPHVTGGLPPHSVAIVSGAPSWMSTDGTSLTSLPGTPDAGGEIDVVLRALDRRGTTETLP